MSSDNRLPPLPLPDNWESKAYLLFLLRLLRIEFVAMHLAIDMLMRTLPSEIGQMQAALGNRPGEPRKMIDMKAVADALRDPDVRPALERECGTSVRMTFARLLYELPQDYCRRTGQTGAYSRQPWYRFLRVLRNVVSHQNMGTAFEWPPDLLRAGVTRVKWHAYEIRKGDTPGHVRVGNADYMELWEEVYAFASSDQLKDRK